MRNLRNFFKLFSSTGSRGFALVTGLALAGCSSAAATTATIAPSAFPSGLRLIMDHPSAPAQDTIQVSICEVPFPTTDAVYGTMALRLRLDPTTITAQLEAAVRPYFERLSHGAYSPTFVVGTTLSMSADESHDTCVDRAIDASSSDATTVLVIATAEHLATAPGGWGRPGSPCAAAPCPAADTRRAVYVGASDFHPDNGAVPLLDLVEHEIGHTLDLPHSGDAGDQHASAIDLMSNSAAPREVQPDRKNGQDTIAIDRLALGWLPEDAVTVATNTGGRFDLSPSTGTAGPRLLVLPLDDLRFLTVEYLSADGFDDFLPSGGVAVHHIDQTPSLCSQDSNPTDPCTGIDREQITLGSADPHLDLLDTPGETWHLEGWDVTLRQIRGGDSRNTGTHAEVEVRPTER